MLFPPSLVILAVCSSVRRGARVLSLAPRVHVFPFVSAHVDKHRYQGERLEHSSALGDLQLLGASPVLSS